MVKKSYIKPLLVVGGLAAAVIALKGKGGSANLAPTPSPSPGPSGPPLSGDFAISIKGVGKLTAGSLSGSQASVQFVNAQVTNKGNAPFSGVLRMDMQILGVQPQKTIISAPFTVIPLSTISAPVVGLTLLDTDPPGDYFVHVRLIAQGQVFPDYVAIQSTNTPIKVEALPVISLTGGGFSISTDTSSGGSSIKGVRSGVRGAGRFGGHIGARDVGEIPDSLLT